MRKDERRAYLEAIRGRYLTAGKKAKAVILDEFCQACGYNRKYAIRLLGHQREGLRVRPGRKPVNHSVGLVKALKRIWLATDQMYSKKLVAAIPHWLACNVFKRRIFY